MPIYTLLTIACFILSPLFSLPLIIGGIYYQKKGCRLLFALWLGVVAYLLLPTHDLYRHTLQYFAYTTMNWQMFVSSLKTDFVTQLLSYTFAQHSIPYDYLRFILTTVYYLLSLKLVYRILDESDCQYSRKETFLRAAIWFLFTNYYVLVNGVRFGFAIVFYIWGVYYLLQHGSWKKALPCFMLAASVHFSMAYFIIPIWLAHYWKLSRPAFFVSIILFLIISEVLVTYVKDFFTARGLYGIDYLSSGQWGTGEDGSGVSVRAEIYSIIYYMCLLPFILFFVYYYNKLDKWTRWIAVIVLLDALFHNFVTINSRIIPLFISLCLFFLVHTESVQKKKHNHFSKILLVSGCVMFFINIYSGRRAFRNSHYERMIYPIVWVFSTHYDSVEIFQSIDDDGYIRHDK